QFTLASPFTTNAAIAVASTSPATVPASAVAATAVPANTAISVTFSRPAQPASITANTSGTACSGSIQVSSDGFVTCVRMAAQPAPGNGNLTFTLALPSGVVLATSTAYKIRVTSGARDADGVPLSPAYTATTGFTTDVALAVNSTS